jgi:hypothetical protein
MSLMGPAPAIVRAQEEPEWETGSATDDEAVDTTSDESFGNGAPEANEADFRPDIQAAASPLSLDAKLEALDGYLAEIDPPTRRYFYTWLGVQVGLVGVQLAIALTSDDEATRGSYFIGSGVASASIGLLLISRRPGMGAVTRYREMPASMDDEKQAKLAMGEAALAGQAAADRKGTNWLRHLLGVGAALGSGAAVALIYEHSLKLATQRVFATFFVSELQIITRPGGAIRNNEKYLGGGNNRLEFGFAPMLDWHAQGISLNARF